MPIMKRVKTSYAGVTYVEGTSIKGNVERIYYIRYRKAGKSIEEKAGRQYRDAMTAAKASGIRAKRIEGKESSNKQRRERLREERERKSQRWTIKRLWESYKENNPIKGMVTDANRFKLHIESIMGDKEPHELSPFDIDRLRLKMAKDHKPATGKNTLELLRRVVNYGAKKRLISPLPFKIGMPRVRAMRRPRI